MRLTASERRDLRKEIDRAKKEVEKMREQLFQAEKRRRDLIARLIDGCGEELRNSPYYDHEEGPLEHGGWPCSDSPTGACIVQDHGYELICVVCGDPDERK